MVLAEIRSPVVTGIVNPVILLPTTGEQTDLSRESRMMLAHEVAHVKRRDLFWLWLVSLVEGLFFFHPLVWLANRESRLVQEIACDELAVTCVKTRPAEYAAMLLAVAAGAQSRSCATPLAVGVVESYRTLKRRLKAMKHIHSQSKKHLVIAALLTAVLGTGIVVPWELVAQNVPAAPQPVPPTPIGRIPGAPSVATSVSFDADEDEDTPDPAVRSGPAKRKRPAATIAPVAPGLPRSPVNPDDFTSDDGAALAAPSVRKRAPYAMELRSRVGQSQESTESRDQLLRYKLIFKSGLARLRHLLNQQVADESGVETALTVVQKLEGQLIPLSEQADNRDLVSTGKVIQEQLAELNAAVAAAISEKQTATRNKRLTRARAIVEGLTELVPDIDILGTRSSATPTVQRILPADGFNYGSSRSALPQ